jgi:hypothetical protein
MFALLPPLVAACGLDGETVKLPNSSGKDDSVAIRFKLTDSNSVVSFVIGCDQPTGCDGHVDVKVKSPEPCALFPNEARCGITRTDPMMRDLAKTTIVSTTEGSRELPLRVETTDGQQFTTSIAAAFTAKTGEEVEITLEKIAGTPDLTLDVKAEWISTVDPGAEVRELTDFLSTVSGLTVSETSTAYPGYRAFVLQYEQPIDHNNPALGTFKQQMVLHHKDRAAPNVLHTSGYSLFTYDYLSEPTTALGANQLDTEQRWFGTSHPADVTPESWKYVDIQQAANDHHRIVQALRAFYSGKWVSTGHSKGGMTSLFHRRFFPADIDATIAYVAPISYAVEDPRYIPWLDNIGEPACRAAIRNVQKQALTQFDALKMRVMRDMQPGDTYERTGGFDSSLEKSILQLEWGYWQYLTAAECSPFLTAQTDVESLYSLVANYAGVGMPDSAFVDSQAYYYQAMTQLGNQSFSTTHLDGLVKHADKKINWAPAGVTATHDPSAMIDMQNWVKTSASQVMFVYGGFDPWTGGAYDIAQLPEVVKYVAPGKPHATYLLDLAPADRDAAVAKLTAWLGVQPNLAAAGGTPNPAQPRLF